jgi:YD repeat-containing protein
MSSVAAGFYFSLTAAAAPTTRLASTTYTYDKLHRLTGAIGPSSLTTYSSDPTGNRLSKVLGGSTSSYKADRILTAGSTSYTVNNTGNLTARGSDSFSYDQANRLRNATVGGVAGSYAYDGRRSSKTVASTTTNYASDIASGLPVVLDDGVRK